MGAYTTFNYLKKKKEYEIWIFLIKIQIFKVLSFVNEPLMKFVD